MSSAVNCEAPVAGAKTPEPVFRSGLPGSSITDKISTGTRQRWLLSPAVALLCFLSGCATTPPPPPAQPVEPQGPEILTDPVPGLVKYRVEERDKLALRLRDGSGQWLTVESVEGDVIRGRDDISVAIADIHELEILPQRASSSVREATVGILGMSVLIPLSIALIPVALPALLIIDWDKPKHWNDGLLCNVTLHPEFYGYTADGAVTGDTKRAPFEEVQKVLNKRQLDCDSIARASVEYGCAQENDSGPSFEACVVPSMARSKAGLAWFYHWTGDALCRAYQDPGSVEYLADASAEEQKTILGQMTAVMRAQKFDCPAVEVPDSAPPVQ